MNTAKCVYACNHANMQTCKHMCWSINKSAGDRAFRFNSSCKCVRKRKQANVAVSGDGRAINMKNLMTE